jgi:hypothetical protein
MLSASDRMADLSAYVNDDCLAGPVEPAEFARLNESGG